jgi:integrase
VQYELAVLRRGFTLAVKQGRLTARPAFPTIRVENARTGFFEPDEFARVIAELPAPLCPLARFAYYTGWRSAEIRGLQWADVDWTAGTIRLDALRSKNGEGRVFPFRALPALADLLVEQREQTDAVQATDRADCALGVPPRGTASA